MSSTASQIISSNREVIQDAGGIFDRAVLLSLEISSLGIRRKVDSGAVEVECDKGLLHVSKEILSSDALKLVARHDADTRLWVRARSIPSKFRAGTFLLSLDLVAEVDAELVRRQARRVDLVRSFLWDYARLQDEARLRLGVLYNSRDYPRVSKVEASFAMGWSYAEMSAPGRLESISGDIYRRARDQAAAQWQSALDEGKQLLRAELSGMVDHLADVLTPGADGKSKRIKAPEDKRSWLSDFQDFLTTFRSRDLAGDDELGAVVDQIKSALGGVPISAIKSDDSIRQGLHAAMESAKSTLAGMVITGGRTIDLGDDEEGSPSPAVDEWALV